MDQFLDHLLGGGRPLVLREGRDAVYQCSERGAWEANLTVVTEGGVEDELLVRSEGWEVVVLVNAND